MKGFQDANLLTRIEERRDTTTLSKIEVIWDSTPLLRKSEEVLREGFSLKDRLPPIYKDRGTLRYCTTFSSLKD